MVIKRSKIVVMMENWKSNEHSLYDNLFLSYSRDHEIERNIKIQRNKRKCVNFHLLHVPHWNNIQCEVEGENTESLF